MSEVQQLNLFGFSTQQQLTRPTRDHRAEYKRRKELERNREELLSRLISFDFDCPFISPNEWTGERVETKTQVHELANLPEEEVVYLHQSFLIRTLHHLGDKRVNKNLKQRIYETWLFQPLKLCHQEVEPFTFQACCRLYWDNIDPFEVQCLFIDSKSRRPNLQYAADHYESDVPEELKSLLTEPLLKFSYPWDEPESSKAHLDHLQLHERAIDNRHKLPSELFYEVVEWINRSGWTDDYRLMPFSFDACCKYAGVEASEHRKLLINKIRRFI